MLVPLRHEITLVMCTSGGSESSAKRVAKAGGRYSSSGGGGSGSLRAKGKGHRTNTRDGDLISPKRPLALVVSEDRPGRHSRRRQDRDGTSRGRKPGRRQG